MMKATHPPTGALARNFPHVAVLAAALADQALGLAGRRCLDVGCGDGAALVGLELLGALAPMGVDSRLAELAPDRTATARRRFGDGQALAFGDASFDALVFFFSLHHHREPRQAIREAARVLRPGGLACFAEPIAEGPLYALERWVDDEAAVRKDAQAALDEALRTAGCPWRSCLDLRYHHPERYRQLGDFLDEMLGVDPERQQRATRHRPQLEAAFEAQSDGVFDQPYRLRVLQKLAHKKTA